MIAEYPKCRICNEGCFTEDGLPTDNIMTFQRYEDRYLPCVEEVLDKPVIFIHGKCKDALDGRV